jgi:hypothetical protein
MLKHMLPYMLHYREDSIQSLYDTRNGTHLAHYIRQTADGIDLHPVLMISAAQKQL